MLRAALSTGEQIFLSAYVIAGPVAWLGLLVLMAFGRHRMSRLLQKTYELPDPAPHVTVVIPAKDEGAGIRECIDRVRGMDYPSFDVIAVNDRSTDDTGRILDDLAAQSGGAGLRVIHVSPDDFPSGWLGKCHALHAGTRQVTSPWILFVDSDVNVEPDALRATLALAEGRKYDAISILTRLECHTFLERLILPFAAGWWSIMFRISLTNDDNLPKRAAANGQFFLICREAYEAVGGHSAVRDRIVEDVELMRLLKLRKYLTRFQIGSHLASTRMHANWRQMLHGWGRIYSGTARRSVSPLLTTLMFIVVSGLSVYPILAWGVREAIVQHRWPWLIAASLHLLLITIHSAILYRGSGNRARYAPLFPLAAVLLATFLVYAIRLCRTGIITWRGTQFSAGAKA